MDLVQRHTLAVVFGRQRLQQQRVGPAPGREHLRQRQPGDSRAVRIERTAGAPGAVMNAINDALRPHGAAVYSQPFTPEKLLRALGRVS